MSSQFIVCTFVTRTMERLSFIIRVRDIYLVVLIWMHCFLELY